MSDLDKDGYPVSISLEALTAAIKASEARAEKAARIETAHKLYKIGEYTQSEFLAVMREEAGEGR